MKYLLIISLLFCALFLNAQNGDSLKILTFNVKKGTKVFDREGLYLYIAVDDTNGSKYLNETAGSGEIIQNDIKNPYIVAYYKTASDFYKVDNITFGLTARTVRYAVVKEKSFNAKLNEIQTAMIKSLSRYQAFVISVYEILLPNGKTIENPNIINKDKYQFAGNEIANGAVFYIEYK